MECFYENKYQRIQEEKLHKVSRKVNLKKRFKVLQKYNFTCQYCGRKAPEVILEIDHKIPFSKGGKSDEDNLIVSCRDCNLGKSDLLLKHKHL